MKLTFENSFDLRPLEYKCFPVTVFSSSDVMVLGSVSGINEGGCLSTEGKNYLGEPSVYPRRLKAGTAKRLWFFILLVSIM